MSSENYSVSDFEVSVANQAQGAYAEIISQLLEDSARARGIGIAIRPPEYIRKKMSEGKAIIAFHRASQRLAGFTYIETWAHNKYVANSGLIVLPEFRGANLGKRLKQASFKLSRKKYPDARIFSITTSHAVMKMNTELGFRPVPLSGLTTDEEFWKGCQSCRNYDILSRNDHKMCLCTGLLFDPEEKKLAVRRKMAVSKIVTLIGSMASQRPKRVAK